MRIYHGHPSPRKLEACRKHAPNFEHGAEWVDADRTPERDIPYIVDNGVFTGGFDPDTWRRTLDFFSNYVREPDFVILPDVFNDASGTAALHREYVHLADERSLNHATVLQPGLPLEDQFELADELDSVAVFVGGADEWKWPRIERIVDSDFHVHVGRPRDLLMCHRYGVDSVDTTSIVINETWWKLQRLEHQQTLDQFA